MNEKGSILLITLCTSSFLFLIFFHFTSLYVVEQKFLKEREEYEILQNLVQLATEDIKREVKIIPLESIVKDTLYFPHGQVSYSIIPQDEKHLKISLTSKTKDNRKYSVLFLLNKENDLISKWVEG